MGSTSAVAAVALGAKVVEKHFILDQKQGGHDALFSMEPHEFRTMVDTIRNVEKALGSGEYKLTDNMLKSKQASRSLFVVEDVKQGDVISYENVRSIRPGYGLLPKYLPKLIDKTFVRDIPKERLPT